MSNDFLHRPNLNPIEAPESKLPEGYTLTMKVIPQPADANVNGDIFGGWVMSQVDLAGAVLPRRYAHGRIATVAVNQFVFRQPVRVGDILSLYARMQKIGRSSLTVHVVAYTEHMHRQGHFIKVTDATLTYVAIDEQGQPREVTCKNIVHDE